MISRAASISLSRANDCAAAGGQSWTKQQSKTPKPKIDFLINAALSPGRRRLDYERRRWQNFLSLLAFVREPNRLLRGQLRPDRQTPTDRMTHDARAKVMFVIPFHFGHFEKTFDEFQQAGVTRVTGGRLVLTHIAALEFARAIHRRQPPADVTQEAERPADNGRAQFATMVRTRAKFREHLT